MAISLTIEDLQIKWGLVPTILRKRPPIFQWPEATLLRKEKKIWVNTTTSTKHVNTCMKKHSNHA